jgi:hypothetical protein
MSNREGFEAIASEFARDYSAGQFEGLYRRLGAAMRREFPPARFGDFLKQLRTDYGGLLALGAPRPLSPAAAVIPIQFERGSLELTVSFDGQGAVNGMRFSPAPAAPALPRNVTEMFLPFREVWTVFWGGDTEALNHHHAVPNQRFAFDFVVLAEDGRSHGGQGSKNEDYYAFGKEVLSPAEGTATEVVSGVRDNSPGSMNPYMALGNCVFIQHPAGEVSVFAHLREHSIQVAAGQKVQRGQLLGLCGNSGNSSEPHLHFHIQDGPLIQSAVGVKCFFSRVQLLNSGESQIKNDYSPVKGDLLSP